MLHNHWEGAMFSIPSLIRNSLIFGHKLAPTKAKINNMITVARVNMYISIQIEKGFIQVTEVTVYV